MTKDILKWILGIISAVLLFLIFRAVDGMDAKVDALGEDVADLTSVVTTGFWTDSLKIIRVNGIEVRLEAVEARVDEHITTKSEDAHR